MIFVMLYRYTFTKFHHYKIAMNFKKTFRFTLLIISLFLMGLFINKLGNRIVFSPTLTQVDDVLKLNQFQGTVLIAKEGKIFFSKGYGFANEEYQILNSVKTIFRIGSLTKQFTAIAILQLQEEGKLNVFDCIAKYLPDYPRGKEITIHHLLSHTSGIPSITDFSNLEEIQRYPSTPFQVMNYFKHCPLKFEPGTNCDYSDSGYIVLGAIIETITRQSYADFIQIKILKPIGMHATYFDLHRAIIPQRASGYVKNDQDQLSHANYLDMSFPHAAGSLATNVEDLYKLDRALKDSQILSKDSRQLLFTVHGASKEHTITYGYGFFLGSHNLELEQADNTLVGHYGTIEGFRAASYRYLDDDLTIILLSNVENTDINALHLAIASLLRSSWRLSASV